ncbi:MAG: RHS repeat-associated core domain-containing protein, partial [Planctomycetales bacterium]|nr:RHS repeat-associated core domain-containing protein [Planctomycetales bacterium]
IGASVDTDGDAPAAATDRSFVYEDNQIVLDFAGSEAEDLAHRYLWGRQVDQFFTDERVTSLGQSGEILWGLTDNLGTVRDLATYDAATDTTTIANHRVYDAFGNLTSETNSAIDTLFEFTGRPFDDATGLQNNLNRWLDSTVGRWLSEDPIGFAADDANLNRYVSNMPLTGTDPDGLIFFFTFDPKAQINISRGAANTIIRHAVESFDFAADLVAKSLLDLASWAAKDPVLKEEFRKIGLRQFGKDIIDSLSDPGKLIALMEAAFQKRVADYHKLIDAGCNDEAQELIGQTAVEFAEFAGALNALRKLAKNTAKRVTSIAKGKPKPNVPDKTPKTTDKTRAPDASTTNPQPGEQIGQGAIKAVFEVEGAPDKVMLVSKFDDPAEFARVVKQESAVLQDLASKGLPVAEFEQITVNGRLALLQKRFVANSKDIVRGKVDPGLLNQNTLDDLGKIRTTLQQQGIAVEDLQFLIDADGRVVIADPGEILSRLRQNGTLTNTAQLNEIHISQLEDLASKNIR